MGAMAPTVFYFRRQVTSYSYTCSQVTYSQFVSCYVFITLGNILQGCLTKKLPINQAEKLNLMDR